MITQPFPFNDPDNILESQFEFRRDFDIPLDAQSGPPEYLIRGQGYWAGLIRGFVETKSDLLTVKDFLDTYLDYRPFDLKLDDYFTPIAESLPADFSLTPNAQSLVTGQNNLTFDNATATKLKNNKATGFKKGTYFSYRNQLFKAASNQTKSGNWRLPIFPNVTFKTVTGNIQTDGITIKAVLDKSSGLQGLSLKYDNFRIIQINWKQAVKWGS